METALSSQAGAKEQGTPRRGQILAVAVLKQPALTSRCKAQAGAPGLWWLGAEMLRASCQSSWQASVLPAACQPSPTMDSLTAAVL